MTKTKASTELNDLVRLIDQLQLEPSVQRKLPLFSLSCVIIGYTKLTKEKFGFSYQAIGAIGRDNYFHDLMNEGQLVRSFERYLDDNYDSLNQKLLIPIKKAYQEAVREIDKNKKNAGSEPIKF